MVLLRLGDGCWLLAVSKNHFPGSISFGGISNGVIVVSSASFVLFCVNSCQQQLTSAHEIVSIVLLDS